MEDMIGAPVTFDAEVTDLFGRKDLFFYTNLDPIMMDLTCLMLDGNVLPWRLIPLRAAHSFRLDTLKKYPLEREDWQDILDTHPDALAVAA